VRGQATTASVRGEERTGSSGSASEATSAALLALSGLTKRFGGLTALDGVSFDVARNETVGLIGPNGSGKTTLFNILSGLLRRSSGEIRLRGREISDASSHEIAAMGVGRTFQHARLFPSLTIFENILLPQFVRSRTSVTNVLLCTRRERHERKMIGQRADHLLGELAGGRLYARRHDYPDTCSLGEQRMIEMMRVLALDPELVLLDEPTQGLNATWVREVLGLVEDVRRQGKTVLLIEHKMSVVMKLCDRIVVLNSGQKICEGPPEHVRNDPEVRHAYLGQ
jgi:branched-chain amino acid transport system ATP-binding protein